MELHAVSSISSTTGAPDALPAFLTVEEAAAVLRIGRTAAYLLARRWEDTGGREGLPVVRFGRLLRVPVRQLERLAAGERVGDQAPTVPAERLGPRASREHTRRRDEESTSIVPEAS